MRKLLLGIAAIFSLSEAYADPVPPRLMRSLKGHHVMNATLQKGILKLVTTYDAVSPEIYKKVVIEGNCSVLLAHPEKGWEKARIEGIAVLSRNERQGYIFLDARRSCLEIDTIKDNEKRDAYFTGKTNVCRESVCDSSVEPEKRQAKQ